MTNTLISSLLDAHAPQLREDADVRNYIQGFLSDPDNILASSDDDMVELLGPFLGGSAKSIVAAIMPKIRDHHGGGGHEPRSSLNGEVSRINLCGTSPTPNAEAIDSDDSSSVEREQKKTSKKLTLAERKAMRAARKGNRKQGKKKNLPESPTSTTNDVLDDDHTSAWKECQEENRVWGGRGHGGRGVRGTEVFVDNLHLPSVTLNLAGNALLVDSPMTITKGHRYALIGRNGAGKSTLLSSLANHAIPGMPQNMRIQLVQQQIVGSDSETALDVLLQADEDRTSLLAEQDECERQLEAGVDLETNAQRLGDIVAELDVIDADTAEDRALDILKGLSFTQEMIHGPTSNLSGGWRMRLALAQVLFVRSSDLWLFDEVTNHLDLHGMDWLIRYLTRSNHTLIVVSHDRSFLDAVCTDVIVLQHQRLSYHVGSYSEYEQQMKDKAARESHILDASERQRQKAMAFVQKQQAMANKKSADPNKQRQAKMIRDKKLDRIGNYREDGKRFQQFSLKKMDLNSARLAQKVQIEVDEPVIRMKLPNPVWPSGMTGDEVLVRFENVNFGYNKESPFLLHDMTLNVSKSTKAAIVGVNGSGKSTLIRIITGDMGDGVRINGSRWTHPNLRIGHVTQYAVEELEEFADRTVVEYSESTFASGRASSSVAANASGNVRQYLGAFGLGGAHAHRENGKLSGGERMRLCFAKVFADAPHLLILDESTNHVDLETIDALSEALNAFQGAVIMVSHNQAFLSGFCNELWVVDDDGRVSCTHNDTESFDEMFSDYRNHALSSASAAARSSQRATKAVMAKKASKHRTGAKVNTGLL